MTAQHSSAKRTASVHQLKVAPTGMRPPARRRLVVPSDITPGSLHAVIQVAFGWEDMHLHGFEDRSGGRYAPSSSWDRALDGGFVEAEGNRAYAGEGLGAPADAVRPVDKALVKRLRKAAFKAGSVK